MALVIAGQIANLGIDSATVQWGAAAAAKGDRRAVGVLLRQNLGFHLMVQLPLVLATVAVLSSWVGLVPAGALSLGLILSNALGSAALLFGIENRTAVGAKMAMLTNFCVQGSVLSAALITASPGWVWVIRELAAALLMPLNLLALDRWGRKASVRAAIPRNLPDGLWRFSIPYMIAGLLGLLVFSRSEIIVLNMFDDAAAVGLFALAFGIAAQIMHRSTPCWDPCYRRLPA